MVPVLAEVAAQGEEERLASVVEMVSAEYALEDAALHEFTAHRLRALLALGAGDPEAVRTLSDAYDRAFDRLPAAMAMRRTTVIQTVARTLLSPEEVSGLFALGPAFARQIPRGTVGMPMPAGKRAQETVATVPAQPRWKFWARTAREPRL